MASQRIATFFIVIFLVAHARSDSCNSGCFGDPPKGGFLKGQAYNYNLDGVATINLSGADNQETNVRLTAQATVYGLGNCDNVLKITSLTITGKDGAKYAKPNDIERPVKFVLANGKLAAQICAEPGDSQKSLNIKRAIISLLQAQTVDTYEADVFGLCYTKTNVNNEGDSQIIHKTRNLNKCGDREQAKQDFLTYITNDDSEIRESQILKSDMRSSVVVKQGVVEKVESNENYLYKPFSVGDNGVKSNVVTKFVLKNTNKGTINTQCSVPKSIIFENPHPVNTEHSNVENILNALKTATDSMKVHVQGNSAEKFIALVRAVRVSSKDDVKSVFEQIQSGSQMKDNKLAKKVFLDALLRAGTGDVIEYLFSLIKDKKLSAFEEMVVLASLSNVKHATTNSMKAAVSLLDTDKLDAYLGVGALTGAYCKEHACHGAKSLDAGVNAVSLKFAEKLGNCKTTNRKSENLKLAVLKGIQNIGHIEECLIDKLQHCVADKTVKQRVRVAALEAIAADACIPKLQQAAIDILKDKQQDSELRIKAYLALLNCPSRKVADEVQKVMKDEPIYQVGSFISSSLENIQASTNPSKAELKDAFKNIKPGREYPLNIAKYSQNYEASYEMNSLGIGGSHESNIIFSQDSFLPRSAYLNMTYEIFGRQVNALELGVRQGNLDRLFEQYLGPQSALHTFSPNQLYTELKKNFESIMEKFSQRTKKYKTKRDVQKQIAALGKKLKTDIQSYNGDLDLDFVVKAFGVESVFLSLGDEHQSFESMMDKIFDFIDAGIDKSKNFAYDVHSNLMFLDMELAYPTSMGLTMKLNLEGALTSKLTAAGNLDVMQLIKDPKHSKIELKFIPSANVEIIGSLFIDAGSAVNGLKTVMSLQTSTGTHVSFKTSEHGFDMQIGLPVEKQELLTASSNVFFFKREKGGQDIDNKCKFDNQNWSPFQAGCFDQFASSFGLTFCADVSIVPAWKTDNKKKLLEQPLFPLNGNNHISIRLEKENLNAYHIKGNRVTKDGLTTTNLDLTVEGPKKSNNIGLKFETLESPKVHSINAKLISDIINLEGYMGLKTSDEEYSLETYFTQNAEKYAFKAGVVMPDKNTYKPILEYQVGSNNNKPISVSGIVKVEKAGDGRKYLMQDVAVLISKEKFALDGFIKHSPKPFTWDMDVKLINQNRFISFKNKLNTPENQIKGFFEMHNSLNPEADFKFDLDLNKLQGYHFEWSLVHGKDSKSTVNKLWFVADCKPSETDNSAKVKFTYPLYKVSAKLESQMSKKSFEFDVEGEYQNKKADFEVEFKRQMKKDGDLYGKLKAKLGEKGVELEGKFEEETKVKGNFYTKLDIKSVGKYEVSGTVLHKNEPNDRECGLTATYKQPGKSNEYKIDIGSISNPNVLQHHCKIFNGGDVLVDVYGEIKHHPESGTLKVILKDALNAQGRFQVNVDQKGNALLMVDFPKWDRKMKWESNFLFHQPNYDFTLDFYPNSGKEENKKMTFNTNNIIEDNKFDSKSSIIINGEKTELNMACSGAGVVDGKSHAQFDIKSHTGKSLSLTIAKDLTNKNDVIQGSTDINMVYTPSKGESPCKASWKGKLLNYNTVTNQLEATHQLSMVSGSGKDLDLKLGLKRTPKGDRAINVIKFDSSGSLFKQAANLVANFDYYDGDSNEKDDINYSVKGSYGDKASMDLTGAFYAMVEDDVDTEFKNSFDLHVALPGDHPFDIVISSSDRIVMFEADEKLFDISSSKAVKYNGQTYKSQGVFKANDDDGLIDVSGEIPNHPKVALNGVFKEEKLDEGVTTKTSSIITFDYGNKKHLKVAMDLLCENEKEGGQLKMTVDLPEGMAAKKVISNVVYKTPSHGVFTGDMKVDVDGQKYALSSNVNMADKHDSTIEFKASYPKGKPARAYIHAWKTGVDTYKGESKFENLGDFNMDLTVDSKLQGPENFDIKVYLDCEKLKLNKINFAAITDLGKNKKVQFSATENGKNVLSGETAFQSREEGSKYIMEGSGKVTIKNEQKSTSVKYIRNKIRDELEKGYEVLFNVVVGEKNILIENKKTNKEYKFTTVYCEENTQCANLDIKHNLETSPEKTRHHMEFTFDLRKLGFAPEFGLRTTTEMERFKLPVHTMDIHMSQEKFKYHVQSFGKPDQSKNAYLTGLIWTTPNRIVSLETFTSTPNSQKKIFPLKHEIIFFFNKNDPSTKTHLKLSHDVKREEHKFASSNSELTFTSPSLAKDLQILSKYNYDMSTHESTFEAVFDIYKKKNQKVTFSGKFKPEIKKGESLWKSKISYDMSGSVDAKALGFEYKGTEKFSLSVDGIDFNHLSEIALQQEKQLYELALSANSHGQTFLVRYPKGDLINYKCRCHHGDGSHKMDATLTLFHGFSTFTNTELTWKPKYHFSLTNKVKDQPDELNVYADLDGLKKLEAGIVHNTGKAKNQLVHLLVDITEKKPKIKWNVASANVKPLVEKMNQNVKTVLEKGTPFLKESNEKLIDTAKKWYEMNYKNSADYGRFIESYRKELEKMSNELKADTSLANFAEAVSKVFLTINKLVADVTGHFMELFGTVNEALAKVVQSFARAWTENVLPALTNAVETLGQAFMKLAGSVFELVSHYVAYASEFIDKNSATFQPIVDSAVKVLKEIAEVLQGGIEELRKQAIETFEYLKKELEGTSFGQIFNENVDLPKEFFLFLEQIFEKLKEFSSTSELNDFFDAILKAIQNQINHKKVDSIEELKDIYKKGIAAFDSVVKMEVGMPDVKVPDLGFLPFLDADLPNLVPPQTSFLNRIAQGSLPNIESVFESFRPISLCPADWIPPQRLQALVAGGQHLFTYDGRHMTYPGSCKYVLSQDAVDGNFSIVLELNKGTAKSITLWDKSGDAVEICNENKLKVNNQPHGFPLVKSNIEAFRNGDHFEMKSSYGVKIQCTNTLDLCYIEASGYYFGKLRGLLGDGNNEPYDDFRMPNGKIHTSLVDFGKAYSLTSCPVPKVPEHHGHGHRHVQKSGLCKEVFGNDSPLAAGDIALEIDNYKEACEHVVAKNEPNMKEEVCLIAKAYQLGLKKNAFFLPLPETCKQCSLDGKVLEPHQKVPLKLPTNQVDIVVTVETTKTNEQNFKEIVLPVLSSVIDQLKAKKMDDIKVTLVGLSPKFNKPLEFDAKDVKLSDNKVTFIDEERSAKWQSPVATEDQKMDKALNDLAHALQILQAEFGLDNYHVAYWKLGMSMKLRPKAKVVSIVVNSAKYSTNPILLVLDLASSTALFGRSGISVNVFIPSTVSVDNTKGVIGFNKENVFVLGDKKRGFGHPELKKSLTHDKDNTATRIEFTGGNIFSTSAFFSESPADRKAYVALASQIIADSVTEVELEKICTCRTNLVTLQPELSCKVEKTKDKRNK